jgi:hypothetical protein
VGGIHITIAGGYFKEDDPARKSWQDAGRINGSGATCLPPDCRH